MFEALEVPEYRRFSLGHGVSLLGSWIQAAAVSWLVYDWTHSERMLGVLEAANLLPGLLVGLWAGAIADRVRPRSMILTTLTCQMVLAATLALLVMRSSAPLLAVIVILALSRVCVTFELPSRQIFLYQIVGRDRLMNAIALNSGLFNGTRVLGPMIAGMLLASLGSDACFSLNALSYTLAIFAVWSIPGRSAGSVNEGGTTTGADPISPGIWEGCRLLLRDRHLAGLFGVSSVFGVLGMGYSAMIPAYARTLLQTDAMGYSLLLSAIGVGATLGALAVAAIASLRHRDRLITAGLLAFAPTLALAAWVPLHLPRSWVLPVVLVCFLVLGASAILVYSSCQTLIQMGVPDSLRGRVMGLWMIMYSSSVPLGAFLTGELAARWGVDFVMELSALATAALGGCLTIIRLPAPAARAVDSTSAGWGDEDREHWR